MKASPQESPEPDRESSPSTPAAVSFEREDGETLVVNASGRWKTGAPRPAVDEFQQQIATPPRRVVFVADEVESWDSALLTWLRAAIQAAEAAEIETDRSRLPKGVFELLHLAELVVEPLRRAERARPGFLARVGRIATGFWSETLEDLGFFGRVCTALVRFVTFRAQFRRSDLYHLIQSTGAEAVPIITLVSVIIGLILAFVGAVQLRLFGADLYIANLVGIAMVREMGAMTVGIIMAGRTGAAFAAQLGTMKVTEEIDALSTFGLSPMEFLVVPRIVALFLMTPFLCLYSMVLGICGGAMVGVGMLGLSPQLYLDQTLESLQMLDLYGGVFRSAVYGVLIGITACLRGMRCGNDAAAVGEATTSAVVTALVVIVIADGVMAVVFNALGI
ncbi:MAG TPA: ABC transporter permease [Planctomycetota bacterium]|nr:ABC transporter permease [Planctomycetota bacterium]